MKEQVTKILIVEDEPIISSDIEMTLEDLGYEVTGIVDNAEDAMLSINNNPPHLILLDINLEGDVDGIMLAEDINENFKIPFIFLTSNADKLTINRVKRTQPSGFIVKPFVDKDLQSNIEIALFSKKNVLNNSGEKSASFFVKDGGSLVKVNIKDIMFIQADDNYSRIYSIQKNYIISSTLKKVAERLDESQFIRIHRSYIINKTFIDKIKNSFVFIKNHQLPIGRSYHDDLFKTIDKL